MLVVEKYARNIKCIATYIDVYACTCMYTCMYIEVTCMNICNQLLHNQVCYERGIKLSIATESCTCTLYIGTCILYTPGPVHMYIVLYTCVCQSHAAHMYICSQADMSLYLFLTRF